MLYLGPNGIATNDQCAPVECDTCPDEEACGGDNCFTFDCPGGTAECPWEDPPQGPCASCLAGHTPFSILVAISGIDLNGTLAAGQAAAWNAFFNGRTFELEQRAANACEYRVIDESPAAEPYSTTAFESIQVDVTIQFGYVALTIQGWTAAGGTGVSTTLLNVFSATAAHGTASFSGAITTWLCDQTPVSIDHYHINGAQSWSGETGYTLTFMPYAADTVEV